MARPTTLLLANSGRTRPAVVRTTPTSGKGSLATTPFTEGRGGLRGGGGGGSGEQASLEEGMTERVKMKKGQKKVEL